MTTNVLSSDDLQARLATITSDAEQMQRIATATDQMGGRKPYLSTSGQVAYAHPNARAVGSPKGSSGGASGGGVGGASPAGSMSSSLDSSQLPMDGFAWIPLSSGSSGGDGSGAPGSSSGGSGASSGSSGSPPSS